MQLTERPVKYKDQLEVYRKFKKLPEDSWPERRNLFYNDIDGDTATVKCSGCELCDGGGDDK